MPSRVTPGTDNAHDLSGVAGHWRGEDACAEYRGGKVGVVDDDGGARSRATGIRKAGDDLGHEGRA